MFALPLFWTFWTFWAPYGCSMLTLPIRLHLHCSPSTRDPPAIWTALFDAASDGDQDIFSLLSFLFSLFSISPFLFFSFAISLPFSFELRSL